MSEPQKWVCYYHNHRPHDIPSHIPNRDQILLLQDVFHQRDGPYQRLISWAGVRYMIVMEPNKSYKDCLENDLLEKMYTACEENNGIRRRALFQSIPHYCMTDLWSHLEKDHAYRQQTVSEIEVVERITQLVFRIKIHGQEYCLKAGNISFVDAVEKLRRAGEKVSNVICLKGLAVDRNRKVIGMVTQFVPGKLLILVRSATVREKDSWKEQISTAVESLHRNGILWGDAKPHNIIISDISGEAVLIDLDGGATDDWVDEELCDTAEGDLLALQRILRFIENLPTN